MRTLLHALMFTLLLLPLGCASKTKAPAIIRATEWGSAPDPIAEDRLQVPNRITLHHAGVLWKETDEPVSKLAGMQKWGKSDKNWPDLPYHFLIAPDGRIFEGRPVSYQAETNTQYDLAGHIGVQLWGNFEEQRVSLEQLRATVELLAWLCEEYKIDPATISGHCDIAAGQTVCPGKDFHRYIQRKVIETWVREKMAGHTPDIILMDPMEGGPTEMIPPGITEPSATP